MYTIDTNKVGYKYGLSGILLLNAFIYKHTESIKYLKECGKILTHIFFLIEKGQIEGRKYEELADLGRILNLLVRYDLIDPYEIKELSAVIDKYLIADFPSHIKTTNFHFCSGILALGNYFIEKNAIDKSFENEIIRIIHFLRSIAKVSSSGNLYWENPVFRNLVFLDNTHGSLSIFKFLTKCKKLGIQEIVLQELLDKSIGFVMENTRVNQKGLHIFPQYVGAPLTYPPKLQWAYGQFNILYSTVLYAKEWLTPSCFEYIYNALLHISAFKKEDILLEGISIAYGSTGAALMFKNLFEHFNDESFCIAMKYWHEVTLKQYNENIGHIYAANIIEGNGFLTGLSGVIAGLIQIEKNNNFLNELIFI